MSAIMNLDTNILNSKKVDFDPFDGPRILKAIPTTESQLEIWLSCIIGGDDANRSYNESVSLILDGRLDQEALKYSLQELIKRHELLHSTFSPDGKSIIIYENQSTCIDIQDLSDLNEEEKEKHIANTHQMDAEKVFDLEKGPLFRSYLFKLSDNRHFLKLSAHHIICDGWSFGIILENISKIYSAKVNNEMPVLDEVTPFSQYSKEQLTYTKSEEYLEAENYWIKQYQDDVPVLNVPTDNPRPTTRTFKSQRLDFQVSTELIESVKSMGAKSGASLVSTLIASFETYLYLLTKQSTIVLGLPASGQSATGNYELVGHCVNMLPLRSNPSGELPFSEYLSKRRSQILDDYDHQQFTFGTLLKKLSIARDSSRIPLIPIVLNIDMGMDANVSFSGLKHHLSSDPRSFENFEIFLNITGSEQALIFEWSYNTQLFKVETIQRMMHEFEALLEDVVADPKIKIKEIGLHQVHAIKQLNAWNNTYSEYPKNKTVADFINEAAIKNPTKTAIYFEESELNYTQLNQQSNQVANYLISLGVKKGDIIGLIVDRSPKMIISLLGIIKSGAAYLPLDPQYPQGRIEFMLEDSVAPHIIISEKYTKSFASQANQIVIEELWPNLNDYSNRYPSLAIQGDDLAYILYTSGSTGKPKGVQIEHHSLTNYLLSFQKAPGISVDDKLLAITTASFDISATEFYLPLIAGASTLLVDSDTAKDGRELLELVEQKGITFMQATPTTWQMMLSAGWENKLALKVLCGGESLSKDLAEKLLSRCSELWNVYGPTETTIWSSIKHITNTNELISIGRPIDNTQIYILDEYQNLTAVGTAGEIYIAGDGLARGYLNRPELTSEKFIHNPFSDDKEAKMYATGDLGYYLENGELICLGRIDAQVKIRGHRIELEEIEYNLVQQSGVKEAVVTAQGESVDSQYLLAHVLLEESDQSEWHNLWNEIYAEGIEKESNLSLDQQDLDIAIINNDEVDGVKHGAEWKNESIKRLKALEAKEILELGTGGGHIMFELAPNASKYIATDYSEVAINKLNEKLHANPEKWNHVSAFAAPADDHSMINGNTFDLVLLHSVVQYFPSLNYLFEVIKKSVDSLNDGGCLFIGDTQTEGSVYMHIAHEQLKYADNNASIKDLRNIIKYRKQQQNELSTDPDFFYFLPLLIPSITAIDVQIRKGEYLNEGTKSHYDVWIYKGQAVPKVIESEVVETWQEELLLEGIENTLRNNPMRVIQIKDIHNQRINKDFSIVQAMTELDENIKLQDLKNHAGNIQRTTSINPNDLWELGDRLGFQTHVRWANDGADGKLEAIFIPEHLKNHIPVQPSDITIKSESEYLSIQKEQVDIIDLPESQIRIWKNGLKSMLPEYMVPVQYIALNRFPTTNNGKIDRKNLPIPEQKISEADFVAPRNETEKAIAEIWSEFLSMNEISIHSNFFESGGHSLTAVRVMVAIEKKFGKKLPISTLFENSTIEKLAKLITGEKKQTKWQSLVPIKTSGSKTPIYLVHGGGFNVLTFEPFSKYMDTEQPIYALQGLGLNDTSQLLFSIEDIASFYISEVLENDPVGPYALGGYCSGGLIAYEMAKQLLEQGKEVSLLAMLDSSYNDFSTSASKGSSLQKTVFYIKSLLKYPKKTLRHFKSKAYRDLPIFQHNDEVSSYGAEVNESYLNAFLNYKVQPINIKINLFKAQERVFYIDDPTHYGWKEFALNGINVHCMQGNHNTFITSPNEKNFASVFQKVIDDETNQYTHSSVLR